jgi:hypothetical protein
MKISRGAQWFHADRRTGGGSDTTKLMFAFGNFAKAPKNVNINKI